MGSMATANHDFVARFAILAYRLRPDRLHHGRLFDPAAVKLTPQVRILGLKPI
jgi:hypothetical protein